MLFLILFSVFNIDISIEGPTGSYSFNWKIIDHPNNKLISGRNISKYQIKFYDIETSFEGTEVIYFTFRNYSGIHDNAGNLLVNNSKAESSPYPYIYVSPNEAAAA